MARKIYVLVSMFVLVVLITACGVKTPAPIQLAVAKSPTITSTNAFTDQFGSYHVVGSILNNTDNPLTSIELAVELKDASGNSLLKDNDGNPVPNRTFSPMLSTINVGRSSPFDFAYDTANGTPATYTVTVSGYQNGNVDRATLTVENAQILDDNSGTLYLTGKLINTGDQWVRVNSLAGAVVDGNEDPLSAGSSSTYATELAPAGDADERDRTPFVIFFPSSGAGSTDWRVYWDADLTEAPSDYPMSIDFTNSFFDQYGAYHIIGYLTNSSNSLLNPALVAGLYAEDGTVLDAAFTSYKVAVQPGKKMPFNISYFANVNLNKNRTEALHVRTFTVQADPARTTPPDIQTVDLTVTDEKVLQTGSVWTFSGNVNNNTDKNLSSATVIVSIFDAQDNLVATDSTYLLPTGDNFAPAQMIPYQLFIPLDPTIDPSGYKTETMVIGDVK